MSVNGSSQNGTCLRISRYNDSYSRCEDPTSSVPFDGRTPTITGLDGDMWASQLLTLQIRNPSGIEIISDFAGRSGVERVELVMFNCPEWGIAVQAVGIWRATSISGTRTPTGTIMPTITSCNSLVRVCISGLAITQDDVIYLRFFPASGSNRTYLAEVGFYGDNATCRQDAIITTPTILPPPDTTTPQPPYSMSSSTIVIAASTGCVVLLILCLLAAVLLLLSYEGKLQEQDVGTYSGSEAGEKQGKKRKKESKKMSADATVDSQVDQKKKDGDTTRPHPPEADAPVDQLYAEVEKKKMKNGNTTHPHPPEADAPVDQLYAQVDKKKDGET